jgi:hypothetical protein
MASPLTELAIRQQIIEPWLAETNSDFYTPTVIDYAINGEYKLFCAETMAGPIAQYTQTGDGVTRYYSLPGEIVDLWRVDYDSGAAQVEIPFMAFQNFSMRFGTQWPGVTSAGTPYAYCVMGDFSVGFHPIIDVKTFSLYGPIVPDDLISESDALLVSSADAYTVAKRAYLWLVERNLSRGGQAPANYQRIAGEAKEETVKARERIRRLYGGIRVAGRMATANITSLVQGFGPRFNWP